MRLLDDLSYYEILELPPKATLSEIRQARQTLLNIYQDDPIVADSFFNEEEKRYIIEKIEQAFTVLSDPVKKAAYDRTFDKQPTSPSSAADKPTGVVSPLLPENHHHEKMNTNKTVKRAITDEARALIASVSRKETISGHDIQTLRESLNLSVEKVFEITKIRGAIIQSIEEDRCGDLPPEVYLKSFLRNYAQVLQLPPEILIAGYTKHIAEKQTGV